MSLKLMMLWGWFVMPFLKMTESSENKWVRVGGAVMTLLTGWALLPIGFVIVCITGVLMVIECAWEGK